MIFLMRFQWCGVRSGGTSTIDKGTSRSLSVKSPVSSRPVTSQNIVGYHLRKISRNKGWQATFFFLFLGLGLRW
jgi:hypothetical protein